ncbi:hypothetical protein FB548_2090 [Pseudoxanthomonas sp. 3HH-4]|uniref:hypothetical protein n=1 Tax=Pseudoxanthomonas sp. 3HH-4 TaxID=1690214 RepID=UPI00114FA299|nr:hypothetical protein [Pseudoxanthomonas sp. 3HH-4]TQM12162.1 hypothetical protein FB548_2090 [Pseudoxanthomonas sp. 3HH-4]
MLRLLLAAWLGALAWPALADDVIRTSPTIALREGYAGYPEFMKDCDWTAELPAHLVEYSKGRVELTDHDLESLPGRTLRIRIMNMRSADGGGFSGPKWAMIRAELFQDGKLIGQYQPYRQTMTLFRGGCSSLSKISDALAADTAAWLLRGDFRVQFADEQASIEIGPEEDVPPIQ